jgi:uncharacterized protein (DUF58 family)
MSTYLESVRRLMARFARRRVRAMLAGAYASVFQGRSLDFEDLREYAAGDDVAAIDWKATARSGRVLVRRSVAERKHHVILVADTGMTMAALGPDGVAKRTAGGLVAGVFVHLALTHGDLVSAVWGNAGGFGALPGKARPSHGEAILAALDQAWATAAHPSDITGLLRHAALVTRRRGVAVVVTDDAAFDTDLDGPIRQLLARHEVMVIRLTDLAPTLPLAVGATDLATGMVFDESMTGGAAALTQVAAIDQATDSRVGALLTPLGITSVRVTTMEALFGQLIEALERHRHVGR